MYQTRSSIEVHHIFLESLSLSELKTLLFHKQLGKKKLLPDERPHGLGTRREPFNTVVLLFIFFGRLCIKEPRDSGKK